MNKIYVYLVYNKIYMININFIFIISYYMINRDSLGPSYWIVRGEILRSI